MNSKDNFIYADYNGTTPVAAEVQDAITSSLKSDWGNPSTVHAIGCQARQQIEKAKESVSSMINGKFGKVIFTSGGTESNNTVIMGLCRGKINNYVKHVITSNVEHDSVALPLSHLKESENLELTLVPVANYDLIVPEIVSAIKENTVLVTIMAANNETGVIMPIELIGKKLSEINKHRIENGLHRIVFHTDAAQILGKEVVDVQRWNVDCLTVVGHKFYGPRIGALWTRISIPPLLFGGGCAARPGTDNTPMIVGLGAASALVFQNLNIYYKNIKEAKEYLENLLKCLPVPVKISCENCPRLVNTSNVSFGVPFTGSQILHKCKRLLAGVGAACHSGNIPTEPRILINSGVMVSDAKSVIRLSLGKDTSKSDVEEIIEDLKQALLSIQNDER